MKAFLKLAGEIVGTLFVTPLVLAYWCCSIVLGQHRVFPGLSQLVALWPGTTGVYLRRALYRRVLPECGADAYIGFGTIISHATARIGPRTYVGSFCVIGDVTLEADVLLGSHVSIINGNAQHGVERTDLPIRDQPGEYPRVTIGEDSWIGDRSVVMFDVGKHCVVGAGSVVTKPLPNFAIAVGNPARIARFRNEQLAKPTQEVGQEPVRV